MFKPEYILDNVEGALDIGYPNIDAFQADCEMCGYRWYDLLQNNVYAIIHNGMVLHTDYIG